MSLKWPKPGINAVGEYQISGQPFLLTFTLGVVGNDGDSTAEIFANELAVGRLGMAGSLF